MKPMQALNKRKADKRRIHPNRQVLRLRQAIQNAGLRVVGYEWTLYDGHNDRYFWFDICVSVDGKDCMIDLQPSPGIPGNKVTRGKIAYCLEHHIPLLLLKQNSSMSDMWGEIEKWHRLQSRGRQLWATMTR